MEENLLPMVDLYSEVYEMSIEIRSRNCEEIVGAGCYDGNPTSIGFGQENFD
jgi:hypothetical protein